MVLPDNSSPVKRTRSVHIRPITPKLTHLPNKSPSSPSPLRSPLSNSGSKLVGQRTSKVSRLSSPIQAPSPSRAKVSLEKENSSKATSPSIVNRAVSTNSDGNNIKVIARFRPENDTEKNANEGNLVDHIDELSVVINKEPFTFDRVFNSNATQKDVFEYSVTQTVDDLFNGYNGTVLAYGQTGSGKSYTMMGSDIGDSELKGLIPRITDVLFEKIKAGDEETEYTLSVSYMEIYLEQIRDLLADPNSSVVNLQVREDGVNGVHVKNLSKVYISSPQKLYSLLKQGSNLRAKASTEMNEESSRSHAIVQINLTQENPQDGVKRSKLFLVDLAGSEKVNKTGVTGQGLEEAKKINSSLSSLGNVINALTDSKATHIPYRDSKLTRILQESLGGNSRTSLIINCSPSSYNESETLSTLRFGTRAKSIKNKAHVNSEPSKQDLLYQIDQLKKSYEDQALKSKELKFELELWKSGARTTTKENVTEKQEISAIKETQTTTSTPSSIADEKNVQYLQDKVRQLTDLLVQSPHLIESQPNKSISKKFEESQEINKAIMLDLEDKCLKLIDMEMRIDELENKLKKSSPKQKEIESEKLMALEVTLEKFSIQMQELGVENDLLRKDIMMTRKIAETRNERIQTLEAMVEDYQAQAIKENARFENKISVLKTRINSVRNHARSIQPINPNPFLGDPYSHSNKDSDNGIFRITEDDSTFVDKSFESLNSYHSNSTTYIHSRKSSNSISIRSSGSINRGSRGKVGFNLNIMKPMKGGSTIINES